LRKKKLNFKQYRRLKEGKLEKVLQKKVKRKQMVEMLMMLSHRALRLSLVFLLVCNISMKTRMKNHQSASTIPTT